MRENFSDFWLALVIGSFAYVLVVLSRKHRNGTCDAEVVVEIEPGRRWWLEYRRLVQRCDSGAKK